MKAAIVLPALAVVGALALSSVFIVDERETVLVLQFGQVKQIKATPGLGFKVPLIQDVVRYDDRILALPTQPLEVTLADDRRLVVDAFARWRIVDLVEFREAVGAGGIDAAAVRLDRLLNAAIQQVLDGDVWLPPSARAAQSVALAPDEADIARRVRDLTPQQFRVLMMLADGLLNKQIAYELGVSEATIKAHVSAILQKLNVSSRTQAVIAAARIDGVAAVEH